MNEALTGLRMAGDPTSEVLSTHEARLGDLPLTVLVGVTGVGKSTALAALSGKADEKQQGEKILPDRREVTDAVMIWPLAGRAVTDREERFRLTAEYRATHPGGMAQALGSLLADTRVWGQQPIFDGLRGLDEVQYAAQHFPAWRFVALGAPDLVRVGRLLGRSDGFDQIQTNGADNLRAALDDLKGIAEVFSPTERDELATLVKQGHAPADILAKVKIVVSERRNYDPQAAEQFLRTLSPERVLVLDTVQLSPEQVAQTIQDWAVKERK